MPSSDFLSRRRQSPFFDSQNYKIIKDADKVLPADFAPYYAKAQEYIEPLRAKIEFWDLKHLEKVYEYDSFAKFSNQFLVEDCDVDLGIDSHGVFNVDIFDSDRYIDSRILKRKNLVVISTKKYVNDELQNLIYGIQNKVMPMRANTNMLEYKVSGVGSGAVLNERIVDYVKVAGAQSITSSNPITNDPTMQANNMMKKLFTDSKVYVVDDDTIAQQLGIDVSLLDSSEVKDLLGGINQQFVTAAQVYSAILEGVGGQGGVNANNQAYMRYPSTNHSGIKLKSWNYLDDAQNTDLAAFTSYFMGPFQFEISWAKEDGFTNRWISKGKTQQMGATSGTEGDLGNSIPLFERALAQKFTSSSARLRDMAFMLQKVGVGTASPQWIKYLTGEVRFDSGYNTPDGYLYAYINIPLTDIPTSLGPVYFSNLNTNWDVGVGQDLWVIFYDIGNDESNTVRWGVIDQKGATNAVRYYHWYPPDPWALDRNAPGGWDVHTNSFSFMFSSFDSFTHAVIAEDPDSIEQYGVVEDFMNVDWAPNSSVINQFATERLWWTSMPKIVYSAQQCTVPGNLFLPGQIISIEDEMADLPDNKNITADILNVHYSFGTGGAGGGGGGNNVPLGCLFVDLSPIGYYNFREELESED
jgi:hypothetical protein